MDKEPEGAGNSRRRLVSLYGNQQSLIVLFMLKKVCLKRYGEIKEGDKEEADTWVRRVPRLIDSTSFPSA